MTSLKWMFEPGTRMAGSAWLLVVLTLAGLPLLVVGAATDSFLLSKQVLFQCAVVVISAITLIGAISGQEFKTHLQPVNGFALLFLIWSAVSIGWSASPDLACEETMRLFFVVLFSFLFQSLCKTRKHLLLAVYLLATASLLVAIQVLVADLRQAFSPGSIPVRWVLGDWRDAISTVALGNTSHLGDFLVFGFLLWFGVLVASRTRWLSIVGVVALTLHAAALIVAWSVHSNLSLILAGGFLLFLMRDYALRPFIARRRKYVIALVAGLALVTAFFVVDHPLNPHGSAVWALVKPAKTHGGIFSQAFASPRWTSGLDTRKAIWLTTLEIIRTHPWLGTGAGNFVYSYPATVSELVQNDPDLAVYGASWTNAAHNEVLQTWSDLGIIGLALLIVMVGASMKASWDRLRDGTSPGNAIIISVGFAMLVALCLQAQMNFPLRLPVSTMLFFCLLSIPHVVPMREGDELQMVVPVERTWGPLTAGITLKNMSQPTTLSLHMTVPVVVSGVCAAILAGLCIPALALVSRPLRADIAYREIYDARQSSDPFRSSPARVALFPKSERVLAIWPGHVDCRSGYQDMLLAENQLEKVIEQTPLVLRKLNATEVYRRRALALRSLGRDDEALGDWDEIFRRQPLAGMSFPEEYKAWILRSRSRIGQAAN